MSRVSVYNITGVVAALLWAQSAVAADFLYSPVLVEEQDLDLTLPAVSDINGKVELYGGFVNPGGFGGRAAGSLSLPVGHSFGLQFDGSLQMSGAGPLYGGAIHAFTRDPNSYLFGITGAFARGPAATLGVIGPEVEVYLDRLTLEGWGGFAYLNNDVGPDLAGAFAIGDIAYYPTDDWRVSLGGSYILGETGLRVATEYLLRDFDIPFSLAGEAKIMSSGAYSVMGGIKGYLGPDPGKSLIDRHRQDDPPNRALSLFAAAGSLLYATPACGPDEVLLDEFGCVPEPPECPEFEMPVWNGSSWDCEIALVGGG